MTRPAWGVDLRHDGPAGAWDLGIDDATWVTRPLRSRGLVQLPEISLQQLMSDFYTQHPSLNDRVVIVEPGVDSCHLDLFHQVIGTCEGVRHRVWDQAVHGECEVRGSEKASQNGRDRTGNATVGGRILWMAGSAYQGQPTGVCH